MASQVYNYDRWFTLKVCDLLYVNYMSVKLIFQKYITLRFCFCLFNKELFHCIGFNSSKYGLSTIFRNKIASYNKACLCVSFPHFL